MSVRAKRVEVGRLDRHSARVFNMRAQSRKAVGHGCFLSAQVAFFRPEDRWYSIYCKFSGAFPLVREREWNIHPKALAVVKRPAEFAVARRLPAHNGLVAARPR